MSSLARGRNTLLLLPAFSEAYEGAWVDAVDVGGDDAFLAIGFENPDRVLTRWRNRLDPLPSRFGVLCVEELTRSTGMATAGHVEEGTTVATLSDPGDLTTLGVRVTEFVHEQAGLDGRVHVAVESLTTLLHYVDTDRLYQFVHTLTGRLTAADADAVFHVDPTAHDERTLATLYGLFDRVVEVDDAGETSVRVRPGLGDERLA